MQIALQLVLPAILLFFMFRKGYRQRRDWMIDVVLVGLILLFVFVTARWDRLSYYFRILLFPSFGLICYVAYRCIDRKKEKTTASLGTRQILVYVAKGLVIFAALIANIFALRGYISPPNAVELSYPLRSGVYYVWGGGSSRWVKGQHDHPPQEYALDIVQLNAFGNRARGLNPEALNKYAIFGDRVYSPCSGTVLKVVDKYPDLTPPQRDEEHMAGNHVVISCKGIKVILAHLMEGSISVDEGEEIVEGRVIGQVGNSGNTAQPHLHIHAERGHNEMQEMHAGEGVPIKFGGRFLVRNSLFTGRKHVEQDPLVSASPGDLLKR